MSAWAATRTFSAHCSRWSPSASYLLLRWAFSTGHSLVERRPRQGTEREYGCSSRSRRPRTFVEAEVLRRTLEAAGVRATLAPTVQGPR
jgi:hypothetical protein